ncbi:MAG: DNA N-6-adenine-methyltransferase [Hyphomicrobium sp.]
MHALTTRASSRASPSKDKGIHEALFTSRSEEWPTPQTFFDRLHDEFNFTLDPCATSENAKCPRFFTKDQDGLAQDWGPERVFCNPPYGKQISKWAQKAWLSSKRGALVVLLVHARTDTKWFHDFVYGKAELRFVRGRLKFGDGIQSAPFPTLVAVYRPSTST